MSTNESKLIQTLKETVDSLRQVLEVQVKPSSEFADEWRTSVIDGRKASRKAQKVINEMENET